MIKKNSGRESEKVHNPDTKNTATDVLMLFTLQVPRYFMRSHWQFEKYHLIHKDDLILTHSIMSTH